VSLVSFQRHRIGPWTRRPQQSRRFLTSHRDRPVSEITPGGGSGRHQRQRAGLGWEVRDQRRVTTRTSKSLCPEQRALPPWDGLRADPTRIHVGMDQAEARAGGRLECGHGQYGWPVGIDQPERKEYLPIGLSIYLSIYLSIHSPRPSSGRPIPRAAG
jgi:hypothetical protein